MLVGFYNYFVVVVVMTMKLLVIVSTAVICTIFSV